MRRENERGKQSKQQVTRRGVALYDNNPFIPAVRTRIRRVTNKRGDMALVNSNTGEIQSNIAGFWEGYEVDSTKFIKLFIKGVKALKELTNAGTKVFEVLYFRVQENMGKDQIYMSYTAVDQALTPMSPATYKRGLAELIAKSFIAASRSQGMFWLNPDFIWNGDRLAFVQEYHCKTFAKVKEKISSYSSQQRDFFAEDLPPAPKEKTSPDLPFPKENEQ